jgi:hypothetical protein
MSTLPVAAQPGRAAPRTSMVIVVLALVAAALIGAAVGAAISVNRATAPTTAVTTSVQHPVPLPPGAIAAKQQAPMARYRQVVADLAAAARRHDYAQQYLLGRQLDAILTPAVIGAVYQEHARLAASLEIAFERHDTHGRALISRQLAKICGPAPVKSRLDFCN